MMPVALAYVRALPSRAHASKIRLDFPFVPPTFSTGDRPASRQARHPIALPRLSIGRLSGAGMHPEVTTEEAVCVLAERQNGRQKLGELYATRVLFRAAVEGLIVAHGIYMERVCARYPAGDPDYSNFPPYGRLDEPRFIPSYFWRESHAYGQEINGQRPAGSWGDIGRGYFSTLDERSWEELPYHWRHGVAATDYNARFEYDAEAIDVRWDQSALLAIPTTELRRLSGPQKRRRDKYRYAATADAWQGAAAALIAHVLVNGNLPGGGRATELVDFFRQHSPQEIDDARLFAFGRRIRDAEALARAEREADERSAVGPPLD